MHGTLRSAGEQLEFECADAWISGVLEEGAAGQLVTGAKSAPDVRLRVEDVRSAFDSSGWDLFARDAWRRPGQVILQNACGSGLDLQVTATEPTLEIVARWRPPATVRAASLLLRSRAHLLVRAVLLQYPALWWSQRRGRVPLHASVCSIGGPAGAIGMIAGPGGIGKSTLVNAELSDGGHSTCDNLCVSDGSLAWGVTEPRRLPSGGDGPRHGRRMPHDRREAAWPGRLEVQVPDNLLVLRRGTTNRASVSPLASADAARILAAGTYMAGELRRYWTFAATLALGSGVGAVHPDVAGVARALSERLPCFEVVLSNRPGSLPRDLVWATTATEVNR